MRKENTSKTSFTSGEMSPWLVGRTDIERYLTSCEVLENFVVRDSGAACRRLGSEHHALTANQALAGKVRAIPFVFSRTQARVIEVNQGVFRFFFSDGTRIGLPYEVAHPYQDDDIPELQFSQSADVLFITHPNYPSATLSRFGDLNWVYTPVNMDYGPYMDQQDGDQDVSLSIRNVFDLAQLKSTLNELGLAFGQYVEYSASGQKMLGTMYVSYSPSEIGVVPLEDLCLVLSREVYSPGTYAGWDTTNNVPLYGPIVVGPGQSIAFSATAVITQEHIGKYIRFCNQQGVYFWMKVTGVDNIVRQGAYGIIAIGDVLPVFIPAGIVTRYNRKIYGDLVASAAGFFNPDRDINRLFRLILGQDVVHARAVIPDEFKPQNPKTVDLITGSTTATLVFGTNATQAITAGMQVYGPGIPYGTTITSAVPGDNFFILSQPATATIPGTTVYVGPWIFSDTQIPIRLYRSLPLSQEGNTTVQNGTTNDWNRGAFFKGNYPAAVCFHEQRLVLAGTFQEPQTGWLSRTADYYNFATTDDILRVADTHAITFSFASDTVNQILWVASRAMLVIGTVGGEWKVTSGSTSDALTPTNISIQNQSSYGSEYLKPLIIGRSLFYVQRGQRRVWEMTYDYQNDDLVSVDVSIFSSHIMKYHGGAQELIYQLLPEQTIYTRLGDGQIGVLTYEPVQKVYAWSRFILGGPQAFVESMACIPDGTTFRLFLVVRRFVNGSWVRSMESILPEFSPTSPTDKVDMIFMDSFATGGGGSANLTGLTHLAGCTVDALVDDTAYTGLTVSAGGALTLPHVPATRWVVGHNYRSVLKTFPLQLEGLYGSADVRVKRINRLALRLADSIGFSYGESLANLRTESFRTPTAPTLASPPLFTGDRIVPLSTGFDPRASFYITQDMPYPLSILALSVDAAQYE